MLRHLTTKFVCDMDTIAPTFFLLGLISALASFEWELIGGMASRGKTRPHVTLPDGVNGPSSTKSATPKAKNKKSWIESYLYGNRWSVPKSFFLHYYLAGTVSLLTVLVYSIHCDHHQSSSSSSPSNHNYYYSNNNNATRFTPATIALFICCILHCVRRSYECYYIHVFSPTAKMHGLFYITAVLYYVLIPANLFDLPLSCVIRRDDTTIATTSTAATNDDCYRSAYFQYITATNARSTPSTTLPTTILPFHDITTTSKMVAVVTVTCFCVWAQYQQTRHHIILANLRRGDNNRASTSSALSSSITTNHNTTNTLSSSSSYQVPMGGWFEYVTCPHYFAEVLLYFSYSLLIALDERWPHLPRVMSYYQENAAATTHWHLFFLVIWECRFVITFWFVVLNLQFSAIDNHNWYCTKFENYTKLNRKTMFPFIY